jgi:hypothetical protein
MATREEVIKRIEEHPLPEDVVIKLNKIEAITELSHDVVMEYFYKACLSKFPAYGVKTYNDAYRWFINTVLDEYYLDWQPEIEKDLVLGYMIIEKFVEGMTKSDTYQHVKIEPITVALYDTPEDPLNYPSYIDAHELVKGAMPAPFPTYKVGVFIGDSLCNCCGFDYKILGYEFPGTEKIDWFGKLKLLYQTMLDELQANLEPNEIHIAYLKHCIKLIDKQAQENK